MATLDIIILVCFIPGIISGLSKGFLEQALALGGIILSVWAAFRFSSLACSWIRPYLEVSETVLHVAGFALVLVAMSLAVFLVARLLTRLVEMATLGWLNRLLGLVFALLVNAAVIGVFIIMFDTLNLKFELVRPETLEDTVLYPAFRDAAYFVFPYLKELLLKQ